VKQALHKNITSFLEYVLLGWSLHQPVDSWLMAFVISCRLRGFLAAQMNSLSTIEFDGRMTSPNHRCKKNVQNIKKNVKNIKK